MATKKIICLLILCAARVTRLTSNDPCDDSCFCRETTVNCRDARLESIPIISPRVVTLDFSGNILKNITSLPPLSILRHLNLSNNQLSHIEAPAFQRLNNLETLDLSHNSLTSLHPGLFSGLYALKHVNLSHNALQSDETWHQATSFRKLDIETLDLSSNGLTRLSRDLIGFFSSVKTLQLSRNNFKFLDPTPIHEFMTNLKRTKYEISFLIDDNKEELKFEDFFFKGLQMKTLKLRGSGVTDLKFMDEVVALNLDLSENPLYLKTLKVNPHLGRTCEELYISNIGLETRDINFLNSFNNLRVLDLSHNSLYLLDGQAIINMPFLHTLDLSQNKDLSELSLDFCQSLTTLERLNLSGCAFEHIDPLIISELGSLSTLDLSYNNFQTLPDIYASIFESVRTINISFNPLHCNCEMLWIVNWTRTEKFLRSNLMINDFICASPTRKPIKEMSVTDFKCREPVIFNITKNMTFAEGTSDVMFHCRAEADPPPSLTWISPSGSKQSNRPSANRTRYVMFSYMKLSPLKKSEHEGWYECVAENQLGRSIGRTYLKVMELETAPEVGEEITSVLTESISTFWTGPEFTQSITSEWKEKFTPSSATPPKGVESSTDPLLSSSHFQTSLRSEVSITSPTTVILTSSSKASKSIVITSSSPTTSPSTILLTKAIPTQETTATEHLKIGSIEAVSKSQTSTHIKVITTSKVSTEEFPFFIGNISADSKHFMNSFENRVAIFVAVGVVCLLATLLIAVLAIVVMRKRHRRRKYLLDKKNMFLRTYSSNGSHPRRHRSNSGVMTTPLNSTLERPRNGFDILLAKEKGLS